MNNLDTMQKSFEALQSNHGLFPRAIIRSGSGYLLSITQNAWVTWQQAWNNALASQAQQESRWNQIETAPKDGSEVILMVKSRAGISKGFLVGHYMQGGHCIEDHPPIDSGWYFWNGRMFDKASEPTHWMPLPPAPEGGA